MILIDFEFVLILVAAHVGDDDFVAGLQAADHFHVFVIAVTELDFALQQLVAVDDKQFVFTFTYIIGSVGNGA